MPLSPLWRALAEDWARLAADPDQDAVRTWAALVPGLGAVTTVQDVLYAIDDADWGGKDEILLFLVRTSQQGDRLAGQVVMHALGPGLSRMVRRLRAARIAGSAEDLYHQVLSEFWVVLGDYPVQARPGKVAANLVWDTWNHLMRTMGVHAKVTPAPIWMIDTSTEDEGEAGSESGPAASRQRHVGGHAAVGAHQSARVVSLVATKVDPTPVDSYLDLGDLCGWATGTGVISRQDADLLLAVYRDRQDRSVVADRLGISQAAMRKRCSRARDQLTRAVAAEPAPITAVLTAAGLIPAPDQALAATG